MRIPKTRRERVFTTYKLVGTLVYAATHAPCSATWIASFVHVPFSKIPGSIVYLKRGLHHRPTSLSISRRDLDALRGDDDDDAKDKADPAAAAEAARNMLERMWTSSETSSEEPPGEGEPSNTPHDGDDPLRDIFPTSCERGALEAATACRKALLDGKRGLIIDVEVRQLEDVHPEFDPKLLTYFVGEIAKPLAAMIGQVKIMYRGDRIVREAGEVMEESKREALVREMEVRDDVAFCSYLSRVGPEDGGYLEQKFPNASEIAKDTFILD